MLETLTHKLKHLSPPIMLTIGLCQILAIVFLLEASRFSFSGISVERESQKGGPLQTHALGFRGAFPQADSFHLNAKVTAPLLNGGFIAFTVDDCLTALSIDNTPVPLLKGGICAYERPIRFQLQANTPSGRVHDIEATFFNKGGPVYLEFVPRPFSWSYFFALALLGFSASWMILSSAFSRSLSAPSLSLVALGVTARLMWYLIVPYQFNSHDLDGHLEYFNWVAQHWSIPAAKGGWEYYQPPLYYFFVVVVDSTLEALGYSTLSVAETAYLCGFLFSLATLLTSVAIIRLCAPNHGAAGTHLALAIIALLPSSLFNILSVNNDALSTLMGLVVIYLALQWWQTAEPKTIKLLCIALPLALLSKLSVLPEVATTIFIIGISKHPLRHRVNAATCAVLSMLICVGPYFALRFWQTGGLSLVENASSLQNSLRLSSHPSHFAIFSPLEVLFSPYVNPFADQSRRHFLWESLFKTAFTDEKNLGEIARGPLFLAHLLSMCFLVLAIRGCFQRVSELRCPVILFTVAFFGACIMARLNFPFGCTTNIRYHQPLITILAVLIAWGTARSLKGPLLQNETVNCLTGLWLIAALQLLAVFLRTWAFVES